MQVWDTTCQQKYSSLLPKYLAGASGALILFPVDQLDSLTRIEWYLEQVRVHCPPETFVIFVGTKSDLRNERNGSRMIAQDEIEALTMRHGCQYIETSAKFRTRVTEPFELVARDALNRPEPVNVQAPRGSDSFCSIF